MVEPYTDTWQPGKSVTRTFSADVDSDKLIWHRDKRDREIAIVSGTGWKLQMDDRLPVELFVGKVYDIPKMEYHRVIKGTGDLVIKIWEH